MYDKLYVRSQMSQATEGRVGQTHLQKHNNLSKNFIIIPYMARFLKPAAMHTHEQVNILTKLVTKYN